MVAGSAHCALLPYWEGVLHTAPYSPLTGYQASRRGGLVHTVAGSYGDDGAMLRVLLTGAVNTTLHGRLCAHVSAGVLQSVL